MSDVKDCIKLVLIHRNQTYIVFLRGTVVGVSTTDLEFESRPRKSAGGDTKCFIHPPWLADKWCLEHLGKVTLLTGWRAASPQDQRINGMEMCTAATHSYHVFPQYFT